MVPSDLLNSELTVWTEWPTRPSASSMLPTKNCSTMKTRKPVVLLWNVTKNCTLNSLAIPMRRAMPVFFLAPLKSSPKKWTRMCPSFLFCSVCSNFNIIPPSLLSQRIQRPRHCYFYSSFNHRQTKKNIKKMKKWCSQQEGKLFQLLLLLLIKLVKIWIQNPEPYPPELLMMRSDRLPILFHQPTTNNKQVARPFFLAFLNCIDSNHLLIISLLGFLKLLYYYVHKELQPFWK